MKKVFIVEGKRSAIGSFLGTLKSTHPAQLGAAVLKETLASAGVKPENVDEVIVGNVLSAGLGQGVGRQISINAGIPEEVPAYSVNILCGSGMKAVMLGASAIQDGASIVVAGGVENMSFAPHILPSTVRTGMKMGEIKLTDHVLFDALTDAFHNIHMGVTAENIAEKYSISREAQDEFAYNSQQKAIAAVDGGKFKDEIVPIEVKVGRDTVTFDTDEFPNRKTNPEKLAGLKAVFKNDGSVTAGNASGINDGASFVVLADEEAVAKYGLKPIAELIGVGQAGVDPKVMGLGPTPAISKALKQAGVSLKDIDLVELNEAFAAQSLGVIHELVEEHGIDKNELMAKTNVNGGAIALGHPVGASGNRIIVTLLSEMKKRNSKLGLASLCIGGGMGTAVVVKSL